MSVINRTTKGKNDRIELAATEKAKVCTSVRSRYLAVESAIPDRASRTRCGGEAATVVLSVTGIFSNRIKGLQLVAPRRGHQRPWLDAAVSYTLLKLCLP